MTYAAASPTTMAPPVAIALISRLVVMACRDCVLLNRLAKLAVVYREGRAAALHDPFTEKASTKIIAIGRIRKIVEIAASTNMTAFHNGLVTRWTFRPPPLDCVLYAVRCSYRRRRMRKMIEMIP